MERAGSILQGMHPELVVAVAQEAAAYRRYQAAFRQDLTAPTAWTDLALELAVAAWQLRRSELVELRSRYCA